MAIIDLDAYLLEAAKKMLPDPLFKEIRVDTSSLSVKDGNSYGIEITSNKPQGTMYMGDADLINNTNESQIMHSESFTKTITDSVTLSVTNGITTGVNISISGKIFGMGVETSMSFEVSTSTTQEQTSTEGVAYTVPSQTVNVPARTTYYVYTELQRSLLEGIVRLKADLSGNVKIFAKTPFDSRPREVYNDSVYKFIKDYQTVFPLPSGTSLNHANSSIHFEGLASYSFGTGTKFYVTISDKPKPTSQGAQEHKPFDAKTGLGTYEIQLDGKKFGFDFNDLKEYMDPKDFERLKELQNETV
ncbi:ETX/MTX2 family pore-forming toxin [Bacillus wiedmannii]|uniref:ETX/MTX2 family pore-forming toxin n=1 Tax=Bacillus wiedmannii TaxID=1890302 RepID=UPI000B4369D8|nr:hypothetical protein BK740_17600 [Bacillus thuringiensis serovar argentinensis]